MNSRIYIPILLLLASGFAVSGRLADAQEMPTLPEPESSEPGAAPALDADGHPVREIRMLPEHKRALVLLEEERNPYARRTPDLKVSETTESGEETEADRLRRVLTGLVVTGKTYGPRGIRLLAGDIILEAGKYIPKVLEDQTEILKVENVTDESITIGWVDPATGEPTGNRVNLNYDLETTVRQLLAGQPFVADREPSDLKFGVIRRKDQPSQMADHAKPSEPGSARNASSPELGEATPEEFEQGQ